MCGIGCVWFREEVGRKELQIIEKMLKISEERGKDAFGITRIRNNKEKTWKFTRASINPGITSILFALITLSEAGRCPSEAIATIFPSFIAIPQSINSVPMQTLPFFTTKSALFPKFSTTSVISSEDLKLP